jgi:hypothetical protein
MKQKVMLISPGAGCTGLTVKKTGRNELCACGSGLKAKRCCGAETKFYSREKLNITDIEAYKSKQLKKSLRDNN